MEGLVESLVKYGFLKSRSLKAAFLHVDRADFVQKESQLYAYIDNALPIGHGQTISQPSTVAMMLELLSVKNGDNVLDIGSGSGWTTALLGHVVGKNGRVTGVELVPELVKFGQENIAKYPALNCSIKPATRKRFGYKRNAPYDAVLISAATSEIPADLLAQIKDGARVVAPVVAGDSEVIICYEKHDEKLQEVTRIKDYRFVFVPLIT